MSEKEREIFEHSLESGKMPEIEKRYQPQYGGHPCLSPEKHFLYEVRKERVHFQIWSAKTGKCLLPGAQSQYSAKHLLSSAID